MVIFILGIIDKILDLWLTKEKTKYIDARIRIEKAYWEEINKPISERDFAILDNLEFELRSLLRALMTEAQNPK